VSARALFSFSMEGMAEGVLGKDILEQLITEDVGTIADSFQKMFISCVENVKKPNVLIAGITGKGSFLATH
jgi:hypothetical protein